VHSFDPCLACAVHMVDAQNQEIVRVHGVGPLCGVAF
jgi:Ni,Fe-hydrogenase I large subunit